MTTAAVTTMPQSDSVDPNKDPMNPAFRVVREEILRLVNTREMTQKQVSEVSRVNTTTLSRFLGDQPTTDRLDRVHERLEKWLATRAAAQTVQIGFPDIPPYQDTRTCRIITEALSYAHHAADMVVIHGVAGAGKTAAAREYARRYSGVCLATMHPGTRTAGQALREIGKCVARSGSTLFDDICLNLHQTHGLLIIDEAHELSHAAVDQIRHVHDRANIGIALIGNDRVYTRMTSGKDAPYLDRVLSRVGMWRHIARTHADDIQELLDAWGIEDPASRRRLTEVARRPGALRLMTKVIRMARMMADDNKPLSLNLIDAACTQLGRHTEGAQ